MLALDFEDPSRHQPEQYNRRGTRHCFLVVLLHFEHHYYPKIGIGELTTPMSSQQGV